MNKKLVGFFICTLLISAALPVYGTSNYESSNIERLINNSLEYLHKKPDVLNLDWIEDQKLISSDGEEEDYFGDCISVYEDYAVIGAYWDTNSNGVHSGSAYVFKNSGSSWQEMDKLIASDAQDYNHFGTSVSIYGDYTIIGADMNNNENGEYAGCAYIFKCDGTSWYEETKLIASDGDYIYQFGFAVSIFGNYVLIGSPNHDLGKGAAYIFVRNEGDWEEQAILKPSDKSTKDFGHSVSLYGDYAVVSASDEEDRGSVYVFKRDGTVWTEQKKLTSSNSNPNDFFGCSLSINGDILLVGSPRLEDPGSTYVFKRSGTDWIEDDELFAPDSPEYDSFGMTVSFDGDHALIGKIINSDYTSSVYIYNFDGTSWNYEAKLTPLDGEFDDNFGESVSIYDNYAFVAAQMDDDNGEDSGSVYVYKSEGNQPPSKPEIDGIKDGSPGIAYPYSFTSIDLDGDDISYYIRWGDGEIIDWTDFQASGPPGFTESHAWKTGTYLIKAKAKDINNAEGEWSDDFYVVIPRTKITYHNLVYLFIERFPILERLLNLINIF